MKYLRGYILSQGGRSLLLGRSTSRIQYRPCCRTEAKGAEVKRSINTVYNNFHCMHFKPRLIGDYRRRGVSTTGNGKNQMSAPNPACKTLIRPTVDSFVNSGHHKKFRKQPPSPKKIQRKKRLQSASSYGKILFEGNDVASSSLPMFCPPNLIETAFLPSFHSYANLFDNIFLAPEQKVSQSIESKMCSPVSAAEPTRERLENPLQASKSKRLANLKSPSLYAVECRRNKLANLKHPKKHTAREVPVYKSHSSVSPSSEIKSRSVQKMIVSPNQVVHDQPSPARSFEDVHRFSCGENKKSEPPSQIFEYPSGDGSSGPFDIHSDRSSAIIHKDLYITNRILEQLKDSPDTKDFPDTIPFDDITSIKEPAEVPKIDDSYPSEHNLTIPLDIAPEPTASSAPESSSIYHGENHIEKNLDFPELPQFNEIQQNPAENVPSSEGSRATSVPHRDNTSYGPTKFSPMPNFEFQNIPEDNMSSAELVASQSRQNLYNMLMQNIAPCYLLDGIYVKPIDHADENLEAKLPKGIEQPLVDVELFGDLPKEFPELMSLYNLSGLEPIRDQIREKEFEEAQLGGELEDWFLPLGREIESMLMDLHGEKMFNSDEVAGNESVDIENPIWNPDLQHELKDCRETINFEGLHPDLADQQILESLAEGKFDPIELSDDVESSLLRPSDGSANGIGQTSNKSSSAQNVPPKKKNPNIEVQTETTIRCSRSGDNTNINVVEIQKYLDKRLPYPFSTETVLQVFGSNDALQKASQVVENSKSQLVHLSNATDPNPGMLTPKLQFNHMLSKTHERTNQLSNNKKKVLKIKVVPNPLKSSLEPHSSPSTNFQTQSPQDPQGQSFTKIDKDTLELMRRSKFGNRSATSKKARRAESLLKLRAKKKENEEHGIIKVLSPKELERLFPPPPKPKPVEVPRNVAISNQPSRGKLNAELLKSSMAPLITKNQKKTDHRRAKLKTPEQKVKTQPKFETQEKKIFDNITGLSPREQNVLKTIISDKVKDSYKAVTKRAAGNVQKLDVRDGTSALREKLNEMKHPPEKKTYGTPAKIEQEAQSQKLQTPKSDVKKNLNAIEEGKSSSAAVKPVVKAVNEVKNVSAGRTNTPANDQSGERKPNVANANFQKTLPQSQKSEIKGDAGLKKGLQATKSEVKPINVSDSIMNNSAVAKFTPIPGKSPIPKDREIRTVTADRSASTNEKAVPSKPLPVKRPNVTPDKNRQYVTVHPEDHRSLKERKSNDPPLKSRGAKSETDKSNESENDMSLPISHSAIIANIMKNSDGEPLFKFRMNEPMEEPNKEFPIVDKVQKKRDLSSKFAHPEEKDFHSMFGTPKSPRKTPKTDSSSVIPNRTKMSSESQNESLSTTPDHDNIRLQDSLFFPFESPIVKEHIEPSISNYPELYEADLCKLSKELKPSSDTFSPVNCKVPLSKLKKFPLLNEAKTDEYYVGKEGAVSINPKSDIVQYKTLANLPAVTRVLGATMTSTSIQALERWKQGLISALGEKGFEAFVQKQLKEGTNFHSLVGKHLLERKKEIDPKAENEKCMRSVAHVLPHISEVGVIESQVVHPVLGYRGVVDCVARYKGKPVVIEWKRSDKTKPTIKHTYDAPLQVSAYIGAINYDNNYNVQVEGGIIVVAYSDGSPADVFEVPREETERYWNKWLRRLHKYYSR